jgi:hypothetical protein
MKFARTLGTGILGVLFFLFLVADMLSIIGDQCSKNLDANDLTWDEIVEAYWIEENKGLDKGPPPASYSKRLQEIMNGGKTK